MKAVILSGGYCTIIRKESLFKTKEMVEIGVQPIHWDIMKIYVANAINNLIIIIRYKRYLKEEFF